MTAIERRDQSIAANESVADIAKTIGECVAQMHDVLNVFGKQCTVEFIQGWVIALSSISPTSQEVRAATGWFLTSQSAMPVPCDMIQWIQASRNALKVSEIMDKLNRRLSDQALREAEETRDRWARKLGKVDFTNDDIRAYMKRLGLSIGSVARSMDMDSVTA